MTLCLDNEESGLPADENFRDKLDTLRVQGRRLCEPSRLAIDKGVSKRVFAALIHISYIYAHNIHGFTDYVIEVNPRHVVFYKRMLGFKDFGGERECTRVGAPAVLLRLDAKRLAQLQKEPYTVFQLDATAYPGSSGSPLFDPESGLVYGIVNLMYVRGLREAAASAPGGIIYAIPASHLQALLLKNR